jgi:hypothetical protein
MFKFKAGKTTHNTLACPLPATARQQTSRFHARFTTPQHLVNPQCRANSGYQLATIFARIPVFECASIDGKTTMPVWNSLKNKRIALCL